MRARFVLALVCCAGTGAFAQSTNSPAPPRPLSLRDCMELALTRNLVLKIQRLSTDVAADTLNGAYGAYSPNFSVDATHKYASELGSVDPRKVNPYFPAEIDNDTLGTDLAGKTPYGFSYDLGGSIHKIQSTTDFRSDLEAANDFPGGIRSTNDHDATVALQMRQHLLKDFWIDSDREEILVRRADLKISQQALRFQIMTVLLAVQVSYDDLIGAREEARVQEEELALRRQFLAETHRRVQVGELPPLDDAQAETQLENTLTQLAEARKTVATDEHHLAGLLTDDFASWDATGLQLTDTLQAAPVTVDRAASFQTALNQRPDLIEARLEVQKNGAIVKFRLNQIFPSLDLVGGYGGLGSDFTDRAALNDAFSFGNPVFSYGLVMTFPLDNTAARESYRASQATRQIAELSLKKAEQEVLVQVADLVTSVEFGVSQVTSTRQAREYAATALDAENKKFKNGLVTSFEVLQFQEILTAARKAEVQAKIDYNKARAQLAFANGTILEQNHFSVAVR